MIEIQERPAPRQRGPVAKGARAILQAKAAAEIAKVRVSQVPKPGASLHYAVTPADGARLVELFRSLDGAEVIEYKKGIVVRHTGREWYVEFTDQAHTVDGASRATAIGADDGGIGLPESNVATVELWGYRGGRTIRGKKVNQATAAERATYTEVTTRDKLLWAGHVGVSLDGGRTIYGLTPERPGPTPDRPGACRWTSSRSGSGTSRRSPRGWRTTRLLSDLPRRWRKGTDGTRCPSEHSSSWTRHSKPGS